MEYRKKNVVIAEIVCHNEQDATELQKELIDLVSKDELSSKLVESAIIDTIDEKLALQRDIKPERIGEQKLINDSLLLNW